MDAWIGFGAWMQIFLYECAIRHVCKDASQIDLDNHELKANRTVSIPLSHACVVYMKVRILSPLSNIPSIVNIR